MNRTDEFLKEIRAMNGLKNAVLNGISVLKDSRVAQFRLITDRSFTQEEEISARAICADYTPAEFKAEVKIVKRVPDAEILREKIFAFVTDAFPSAGAFLDKSDVKVQLLDSGANFYLEIASGEQTTFASGRILDEISKYLSSVYCGTFFGNVKVVEKTRDESILDEIPESKEEEYVSEIRTFPIEDFQKIDGVETLPKEAVYIADVALCDGPFSVCGTLTYVEEKHYVKHNETTGEDVEKTRFSLTLNDGSAMMRVTYFPKKATVDRVRELKVGDSIVLTGSNEEYNGNMSFKAGKLNLGHAPAGFVPTPKKSKPVPKFYHAVHPERYDDYTQAGFFDDLSKPDDLKKHVFVVFDLETTGLVSQPAMGKMDRIIEIGAVKIVGGEITEKFSSFVACPDRLSPKIVELTGIHDEDLIGAPTVEEVIPDFYKFVEGAILVGHNVTFDYNFIRHYGGESGYAFENPSYDTVALAQTILQGVGLANYKLNTIADYYGFTFNHHRAYADAAVTAKIFMELIKTKGKLPF